MSLTAATALRKTSWSLIRVVDAGTRFQRAGAAIIKVLRCDSEEERGGGEPDVGNDPASGHRLGNGDEVRLKRDSYIEVIDFVHHVHSSLGSSLVESEPFQAFPHFADTLLWSPVAASKAYCFVLHSLQPFYLGIVPGVGVPNSRGVLHDWAYESSVR